jgi:predicted dehydrogenase
MNPPPARVLIVGLGSIGRRHASIARELLPEAEIMVLRHERCGDLAGTGIDRCVTSIAEAVRFGPQVAVIANPASHHLAVALPLAEAGVPLLVEKPLSHSAVGVAELIELCRQRAQVFMTGYNLRFHPSLQEFRRLVCEGAVGRILSVRAEAGQYLPTWRQDADYRIGVSARAELGGGVLLELSHEIDYLSWCFGDVAWVSAVLAQVSDLEIDVEDVAYLTLGFLGSGDRRGAVATLSIDFIRHDAARCCVAIGDRGTLRWSAAAGTVEQFDDAVWRTVFLRRPERDDSYREEWRQFLDCVRKGTPAPISGDDGLAALRIVDAARKSSETGALVRLVPLGTVRAVPSAGAA